MRREVERAVRVKNLSEAIEDNHRGQDTNVVDPVGVATEFVIRLLLEVFFELLRNEEGEHLVL